MTSSRSGSGTVSISFISSSLLGITTPLLKRTEKSKDFSGRGSYLFGNVVALLHISSGNSCPVAELGVKGYGRAVRCFIVEIILVTRSSWIVLSALMV
jgi:hypothetical protein